MQGGAVQGIGWALNEEYIYDKDGRLENPGFLDYRIPVCSDVPMIDTVIVEVPNPRHPYGVRGVGETPIVPPMAAIANAVANATGIRFTALPMSPPRVLEAIDDGARLEDVGREASRALARVVLSGTLKQLAGGASEIELEARDVRQLLRAARQPLSRARPSSRARAMPSPSTARSSRTRGSRPSAPTAKCIWCRRFAAADANATMGSKKRMASPIHGELMLPFLAPICLTPKASARVQSRPAGERRRRSAGNYLRAGLALALLALQPCAAVAHETDQYTLPVGREFADLGPHFSRVVHACDRRRSELANAAIKRSLRDNASDE